MSDVEDFVYPANAESAAPPVRYEELRRLVVDQKRVILALAIKVFYIPLSVLILSPPSVVLNSLLLRNLNVELSPEVLADVAFYGWLLVSAYALYAVYKLAGLIVREQGSGILYVGLMFIPLVGLVVALLLINRAAKILKRYGLNVGLLGADMKQFDSLERKPAPTQ